MNSRPPPIIEAGLKLKRSLIEWCNGAGALDTLARFADNVGLIRMGPELAMILRTISTLSANNTPLSARRDLRAPFFSFFTFSAVDGAGRAMV
jgi:hypothetical protein